MKDGLDCRRAEELLSDHLGGTLPEPLLSDLEGHLAACAECSALREALVEVVSALREHPVLEPAAGLAERAASMALARRPPRSVRTRFVPPWLNAAAATLAVAVTALVLLATGAVGSPRTATRVKEHVVNTGAYLAEKKDRLVEDFRILRVVIGTAFGSRVDRVNDRVDDYRRLLERRKAAPGEQKKSDAISRTSAAEDS